MSFVYFRLPNTTLVVHNKLNDEPEELSTAAELNGRSGFVIAPFAPSTDMPILLVPTQWETIEPSQLHTLVSATDNTQLSATLDSCNCTAERTQYNADFNRFHAELKAGRFAKIVLARSTRLTATARISALTLFARACQRYPRMFIALYSTKRSGTWLVATPETLIGGHCGQMHTMALAGTMRPGTGEWSDKNKREQKYVETYITECVRQFSDDINVEGPYTTYAADLQHLRSDIRFSMNDTALIGNVVDALHPTPAICGIPKDETRRFIIDNESQPRGYYSGFAGPFNPNGDTHLFVTLRCMHIESEAEDSAVYRLFAGGGLLKDSTEQDEWNETEAKMNTIRKLFDYVQQ